MSVFDNCWSSIHDFDRGLDETNWQLLPSDTPPILDIPSMGEFSQVGLSLEVEESIVPLTVGSINKPIGEVRMMDSYFYRGGWGNEAAELRVIVYTGRPCDRCC